MGWWSKVTKPVRNVVRPVIHPSRLIALVKNPSRKIVPDNLRNSKGFQKFGKPIIKIAAAVAIGAGTGGLGAIVAGGSVFTGVALGAGAAGLTTAASGGLTSKGFQPFKNIVNPAITGFAAGTAASTVDKVLAAGSPTEAATAVGVTPAKIGLKAGKGIVALATAGAGAKASGMPAPESGQSGGSPVGQTNETKAQQPDQAGGKSSKAALALALGGTGFLVAGPPGAAVGAISGYAMGENA